ncbi:Initiator tRNA phosphoribosyl transferase [Penicillium concentricum]|uniref:Initiator tRNA phosphoribosyl transferase n=1 Tax=Penicillium concentricum TaxID=293559 RepID=A0A9W9SRC0_9EURO|nr:Initiator tRNA phosphoribosyl transferase [Penicillium concentricum]KAJ5382439.1 Initiator tRNA phosphoribosyl transferase [Penicillium concentricum]
MGSDTFSTLESLHFPEQLSISQTLSSLCRSALSVANRLQSIKTDATFAQEVADHYGLPLVANERCGSWYIPPMAKAGSAYFKSTDGHTGQGKACITIYLTRTNDIFVGFRSMARVCLSILRGICPHPPDECRRSRT